MVIINNEIDTVSYSITWERDNSIYLQDSLIIPIKSGLRKLLNTTRQIEAWLVMISCNLGVQKRFITITKSWYGIEMNP